MKPFRILLALIVTLFAGIAINAQHTSYSTLAVKAQRYYNYQEWPNAAAMYELMLAQRPDVPATYSYAIVTAAMRNDTTTQVRLMERAAKNAVPFDSLFSTIRHQATLLGHPTIYSNFMHRVAQQQPWMKRIVDIRLLEFYRFRRDADSTIATVQMLLETTPDNIEFITALAEAYTLKADMDAAESQYRRILELDPNNLNTLLILGNYYRSLAESASADNAADYRAQALAMLSRAQQISATPYLNTIIKELQQ